MRKIVLIPDSFKGTMSSMEICDTMREQLLRHLPGAQVLPVPVADGGEGSVDSFLAALGGSRHEATVAGPYFEDYTADYALLADGTTAVVEMAACAGLPLVEGRANPEKTTTYGVGQLIGAAARQGAKTVIVGIGGSATNDGGCGAAAGAGAVFRNAAGASFVPTGATLCDIHSIELAPLQKNLAGVKLVTMCDVDNPLFGPNGAAAVFGPQKGADAEMVRRLDDGLRHLGGVIREQLGMDVSGLAGGGAAGGLGAGMAAFFGAPLRRGIDVVLDTVDFERLICDADLVITGEGKLDSQSLRGKVVIGVARRAKCLGVPVFAVVGDIGDDIDAAYDEGLSGIFSINRVAVDFAHARHRSRSDLAHTMANLARVLRLFWDGAL